MVVGRSLERLLRVRQAKCGADGSNEAQPPGIERALVDGFEVRKMTNLFARFGAAQFGKVFHHFLTDKFEFIHKARNEDPVKQNFGINPHSCLLGPSIVFHRQNRFKRTMFLFDGVNALAPSICQC